jgi:hypothetical protein
LSDQESRGGQHQDGKVAPFLAPHPEHGQPVDLGQAQIEDRGVVLLGRAEEMAVLAVGGKVHRVTGLFQRAFQLLAEGRFILDDQDAHGWRSPAVARLTMWALNMNASTGRPFPQGLSRDSQDPAGARVDVDPGHLAFLEELEAIGAGAGSYSKPR